MEGYPVAEVAAMLDCPPGTVKSRCSRGRARLAVLLDVLADESPGARRRDEAHGDPGNPPAAAPSDRDGPARAASPRTPPPPT